MQHAGFAEDARKERPPFGRRFPREPPANQTSNHVMRSPLKVIRVPNGCQRWFLPATTVHLCSGDSLHITEPGPEKTGPGHGAVSIFAVFAHDRVVELAEVGEGPKLRILVLRKTEKCRRGRSESDPGRKAPVD